MRVGFNREDFSTANAVVASYIVDGGFQNFPLTLGDVLTFRRNGPDPYVKRNNLVLNEIKVYETANLLSEEQGRIEITSDTSESLQGYEPINLL